MTKLNKDDRERLLNIVKKTVETYVKEGREEDFEVNETALNIKCGAFVSIHKYNCLRGCIGRITSNDSLWKMVRSMAIAACAHDYRFEEINVAELQNLEYEISVLSETKKIDDWKKIELGKHGVIISKGSQSGVFLPQVALETGWNLDEFLGYLCKEKVGIDRDAYKDDKEVVIEVFEVQVFNMAV